MFFIYPKDTSLRGYSILRFEMSRFFAAIYFRIGFGKFYGFEIKVLNSVITVFVIENDLLCHLPGSLFRDLIN